MVSLPVFMLDTPACSCPCIANDSRAPAFRCSIPALTRRANRYTTSQESPARHPAGRDLLLFLGREPNLRRGAYANPVLEPAARYRATLLDAARRRGLPAASLWGHAPHYIQAFPNVKVCHGVLTKLKALVDLPLDFDELKGASRALEARVDEASKAFRRSARPFARA